MNNSTDETAPPPEMEKMDGDRISDSDLSKEETDVFKTKAQEQLEKLQVELEEFREAYRKEVEVWNKEREEHNKIQHDMIKDYDELRKQMQLWPLQARNTHSRRRPVPLESLPVRNSDMRLSGSSQEDQAENIEEADESDLEEYFEADEPDVDEDLEADEPDVDEDFEADEPDVDEDLEADEPDVDEDFGADEPDVDEDLEADEPDVDEDFGADDEVEENNEEEQEEMEAPEASDVGESAENVLEYTPVASEIDLRISTRTAEDGKRKASSLLEIDNGKKRRLTLVECPVCQESLPEMTKSGKILMAARCGHVLCSNCAMRIWVQRQKRCPTCNTRYSIEKLLPVYL